MTQSAQFLCTLRPKVAITYILVGPYKGIVSATPHVPETALGTFTSPLHEAQTAERRHWSSVTGAAHEALCCDTSELSHAAPSPNRFGYTQGFKKPLIKEGTVTYNKDPYI